LQQVIPGQHKSTGHQCAIGNKTHAPETRAETPKDENRHHAYQRSELAQLDADIYTNQINQLESDEKKLKEKIKKFRLDELHHKDIAYKKGATKKGPYSILDKIIKTGSKIAINISEKI